MRAKNGQLHKINERQSSRPEKNKMILYGTRYQVPACYRFVESNIDTFPLVLIYMQGESTFWDRQYRQPDG